LSQAYSLSLAGLNDCDFTHCMLTQPSMQTLLVLGEGNVTGWKP
jgi:hypothetical protein